MLGVLKPILIHGRMRPTSTRSFAASVSDSFYAATSGRSRRRRVRDERLKQNKLRFKGKSKNEAIALHQEQDMHQGGDDDEDTRTVMDIVFPNPHKDSIVKLEKSNLPTTFGGWIERLSNASKEYRASWEGFFTSRGLFVETKSDREPSDAETVDWDFDKGKKEVSKNVKRNAEFLENHAIMLQKGVRDATGIKDTEDLKSISKEAMTLASECLKEFMVGYRKGRDDEVEKMLTEYFEEIQKEVEEVKPRRRRIKRRVMNERAR